MAAKVLEQKGFDPRPPADRRVEKKPSKATKAYTGAAGKRLLSAA
jgi:hypothetical protein